MRDVKSYEAELEAAELKIAQDAELLKKKRAVLAEFKQLFGERGKEETHQKPTLPVVNRRNRVHKKKSARRRIREAILKMTDPFESKDLWSAASEDGQGPEIERGTTFQPYLTKLQDEGYVVKVQEHVGTTPALFHKGPKSSEIVVG